MEKKERNELKNRFIDNGWSYKFEEYQDGDINQFELEEFFLDFVEQEIDKAREEVATDIIEIARKLKEFAKEDLDSDDAGIEFYDLKDEIEEKYLSKLNK